MAGRLLSFKDYIGGADNVQVIEMFPTDQQTFTYNFDGDVSGYEFTADYQSLMISSLTYDRVTGDPNFADSTVSGYFTNYSTIDPATYVNNTSASSGIVNFTIPSDRYTGNVLPDARANVVGTVVSFQWQTDDVPAQSRRHRWLVLERFDPQSGKNPEDPALNSGFVAL
jgi:hypothetical protein